MQGAADPALSAASVHASGAAGAAGRWRAHFAYAGGYHSIYDMAYHPDIQVKGFFLSLLLVHAWNTMDRLTWNGASWFVSVEFGAVPAVSALCSGWPMAKAGAAWSLIAAGHCRTGCAGPHLKTWPGIITFHNGVARGLSDFSVGVGMAMLYRRWKQTSRRAFTTICPFADSGSCCCSRCFTPSITPAGRTRQLDIWRCPADAGDWSSRSALIAALSPRPLKTRLPQVMGPPWSYAIYMGQTFWLQAIRIFEQAALIPRRTIPFVPGNALSPP